MSRYIPLGFGILALRGALANYKEQRSFKTLCELKQLFFKCRRSLNNKLYGEGVVGIMSPILRQSLALELEKIGRIINE